MFAQHVIWIATLLSFLAMLVVLFGATPETFKAKLDAFVQLRAARRTSTIRRSRRRQPRHRSAPAVQLLATLLVAPIAWTSLQWASYSAQQNGEIKGRVLSRTR
jgi:hypothetical protein